jgi:hypothetical protein
MFDIKADIDVVLGKHLREQHPQGEDVPLPVSQVVD